MRSRYVHLIFWVIKLCSFMVYVCVWCLCGVRMRDLCVPVCLCLCVCVLQKGSTAIFSFPCWKPKTRSHTLGWRPTAENFTGRQSPKDWHKDEHGVNIFDSFSVFSYLTYVIFNTFIYVHSHIWIHICVQDSHIFSIRCSGLIFKTLMYFLHCRNCHSFVTLFCRNLSKVNFLQEVDFD